MTVDLFDHEYPSRAKKKMSHSLREAYERMDRDDNAKGPKHVTKEEWNKIIETFNQWVMEELLAGNAVEFPGGLGTLRIKKFKWGQGRGLDFHLSKVYGRRIFHDNLEYNGFAVSMRWKRPLRKRFRWSHVWQFKLVRDRMRRGPLSIREYVKKNGVHHFVSIM